MYAHIYSYASIGVFNELIFDLNYFNINKINLLRTIHMCVLFVELV